MTAFSITEMGIGMVMQLHPKPSLVIRAGLIVLLLGLVWAGISLYTDEHQHHATRGEAKLSLVPSLVLLIGTASVGLGLGLMI